MRSLWLSYKIGFRKNKQTESAQNQRSEGASMATRWTRRRGNQAQGREKTSTFLDLNYFYTEESIPCTKFYVRVTPFA